MRHTAQLGASAALYIHDGTHGSTCTTDAAEQTTDHVTDTLSYELLIAVVVCLGNIVGHYGSQQGIDASQTCQCETWYNRNFQHFYPVDPCKINTFFSKERHGESTGDGTDKEPVVHVAEE